MHAQRQLRTMAMLAANEDVRQHETTLKVTKLSRSRRAEL